MNSEEGGDSNEFTRYASGAQTILVHLNSIRAGAESIAGASAPHASAFSAYCRWITSAGSSLRGLVDGLSVHELLGLEKYWSILQIGRDSPEINWILAEEQRAVLARIDNAIKATRSEIDRWTDVDAVIVPDTNVFLEHRQPFDDIDWSTLVGPDAERLVVVVPILVVEEIDKAKRDGSRRMARARETLRRIDAIFSLDTTRQAIHQSSSLSTQIEIQFDTPSHRRLDHADSEIVRKATSI